MLFYRVALLLFSPIIALWLIWRLIRGKENLTGLANRLGSGTSQGNGKTLWLHGASIGELTSAKSLVDTLLTADADLQIVMTSNTYSAKAMVENWQIPRIVARLAPLDYQITTMNFIQRWHPSALVVLENEMWPNRLNICHQQGIPVHIVGGRMSARAASTWARFPKLARQILSTISQLAPQDAASGKRFSQFGLPQERIGPLVNLKSHSAMPDAPNDMLEKWSKAFSRQNTWLAASTHEGEELAVLQAHKIALQTRPELRLILAPRHPERADSIVSTALKLGLSIQRRTETDPAYADHDVILADTFGEMAIWYQTSYATFVGGTLVDKGGHTPFEPAQFQSAIVHGPFVANHLDAFSHLDEAHGAVPIGDAEELAAAIIHLSDVEYRTGFTSSANTALRQLKGNEQAIASLATTIRRSMNVG